MHATHAEQLAAHSAVRTVSGCLLFPESALPMPFRMKKHALLQDLALLHPWGMHASQGRRSVFAGSEAASHAGSRVITPALRTSRKPSSLL